ncbi:unnamed protein product, partial [Scytosiphon promiscuus]
QTSQGRWRVAGGGRGMKRRRSSGSGGSTTVPGSSRSQGSRPDVGELIRLLGTAAEGNRSDEIEALAAKGIDLSAPSGSAGLSALHRATLTGSLDALLSVGQKMPPGLCRPTPGPR